jgi:hypothetical protein
MANLEGETQAVAAAVARGRQSTCSTVHWKMAFTTNIACVFYPVEKKDWNRDTWSARATWLLPLLAGTCKASAD